MADSVATKVLYQDDNWYIASFTNICDSTGESSVTKVDISALTPPPKMKVSIEKVWYSCYGMAVSIFFDADTDDRMLVLQGDGVMDFSEFGGIMDPRSTAPVGDILFTTEGETSGDTYTIVLKLRKH